jgi:hypothetical protein
MPWEEMCALVGFLAEESERDLRERLAALSAEERRLLGESWTRCRPTSRQSRLTATLP